MSSPPDQRIAITEAHSLSAADRAKAEKLVTLCAAADGFPQEFQDDSALNSDRTLPPWVLAHSDSELVGIACLFAPSRREVEVSAWTAPDFRQKGVFGALDGAIRLLAGERGIPSLLFCVDSRAKTGARVALNLGATLDFSEFEMAYDVAQGKNRREAGLERVPKAVSGFEVRKTTDSDVDGLARASVDIFGDTEDTARNFIMVSMAAPARTQYTALLEGRIVGMCATSVSGTAGSVMINGLGIMAALRGKGLGRALLHRVMEIAAEEGAEKIVLEVDSVNEAAYPLYRSAGFTETLRTDYYRLKL